MTLSNYAAMREATQTMLKEQGEALISCYSSDSSPSGVRYTGPVGCGHRYMLINLHKQMKEQGR